MHTLCTLLNFPSDIGQFHSTPLWQLRVWSYLISVVLLVESLYLGMYQEMKLSLFPPIMKKRGPGKGENTS